MDNAVGIEKAGKPLQRLQINLINFKKLNQSSSVMYGNAVLFLGLSRGIGSHKYY